MADSFDPITGARIQQSPMIQKSALFTRPANATQYTGGDAVAPVTTSITAGTNTTPIVLTAATHGLATGDRVFIAGMTGLTNANGIRKVTVLTVNTFSLQDEITGNNIAGNGAYGGAPTFQPILRFADVVPQNGGQGAIVSAKLQVRNIAVALGTFRLRFYTRAIAQIADNAAFTLLDANKLYRVGYVDLTILTTAGAGSDSSEVVALLDQPLPFTCEAGRADLFVQVEAIGAYTPAASDIIRVEVTIRRDQVPSLSKVMPM